MKPLPTLIKKIKQILRLNQRIVPLLDMVLMILVIAFMIMKNKKSLGAEMSYSMRRFCIRIRCRKRNRKNKTENTQCLMRSQKKGKVPENHNDQQPEQLLGVESPQGMFWGLKPKF